MEWVTTIASKDSKRNMYYKIYNTNTPPYVRLVCMRESIWMSIACDKTAYTDQMAVFYISLRRNEYELQT